MNSDQFEQLRTVAGPVSRETFDRLIAFQAVFEKWAQRINLVSPSTLPEVWQRHILDSAQLARLQPEAKYWVDLGSGGGFPGLILAFLLAERAGASIALIESNRKKAGFLQAIIGEFSLPARVHAKRIEDCWGLVENVEVVTARALAPLPLLLRLSVPWLKQEARGLFHKGRDYRTEVEESAKLWRFELIEHRSVIDPQSVILEIDALRDA
ncbi:16S rRNA (guanine(527)-N(7))-methyltransferase RsmG [Pseudaminobacter arsenicus]|uniref:Ribosomal RNA small subunit methyltransferase G n=1 Tax=Borborobacter arsenicus TaxID=1851146 RepID=A0A432V8V9_9HYPH|nr:16S rRNA (guanine(527)-N(7))-methyltransferase RsmG [Pseudaminobacter arsenicus]RUM98595.1 16S rRNA (guanine(527)-N(7))-methyltransferase RsmG [Pseudaminobacter arsenicus]